MATTPRRDVAKPRPGPSDHLIALFRTFSRDPTQGIGVRLKDVMQEFLQHRRNNKDDATKELEQKSFLEASKHYYTTLERFITQERSKSGSSDIPPQLQLFLENDLNQRCLVACCLQNALKSNRVVSDVGVLLNVFKLEPYRFLEVTEKLQLIMGKFMETSGSFQIRTRVLESSVWASSSGLWKDIRANGGCLPSYEQTSTKFDGQRTDLQQESDPSSHQADVALVAESSASTHHQRSSSAVSISERKPFLHRFARMVYVEMGDRLRELCSKLDVSDELRSTMWTCLEHSLVQHSSLVRDRHLDQLLISAIYIIAKVTQNKLNFEEILKHYKFQPHASEIVSKDLLISETPSESLQNLENLGAAVLTPDSTSEEDERSSVINFYHLYSMKMQQFAQKFAPTYGGETPPLSPFPPQQKKKSYRLSHRLTISSLNQQTASPRTPIITYNIGKSPREHLGTLNGIVKKGGRALPFDTDEGEDGPSFKCRRVDGDSVLQNRLMDMVKDREVWQNRGWVSQDDPDLPDGSGER